MGSKEFQTFKVDAAEHGTFHEPALVNPRRMVPVGRFFPAEPGRRRCPAIPRPWQALSVCSGFPAASGQFCCALGVQEFLPGCGASSVSPAGLPAKKVGWEQGWRVWYWTVTAGKGTGPLTNGHRISLPWVQDRSFCWPLNTALGCIRSIFKIVVLLPNVGSVTRGLWALTSTFQA